MKHGTNRRSFLKSAGVCVAGVGLTGLGRSRLLAAELARGAANAEKIGWRLGCETWSFRHLTFFEAIDTTASLGLHYSRPSRAKSSAKTARMCSSAVNCRPTQKNWSSRSWPIQASSWSISSSSCRGTRDNAARLSTSPRRWASRRSCPSRRKTHGNARQVMPGIRHQHRHPQPSEAVALLERRHGAESVPRAEPPNGGVCRHGPLAPMRPGYARMLEKAKRTHHQLPLQGSRQLAARLPRGAVGLRSVRPSRMAGRSASAEGQGVFCYRV